MREKKAKAKFIELKMNIDGSNMMEEEEIKIEYGESFEKDPLSDKNLNPYRENIKSVNDIIENFASINNQTLEASAHVDHKRGHNLDYGHSNNYDDENSTSESSSTWYDSVDNSGRFLCKFCDLKYSTLQTLRYHVKMKHPDQADLIKKVVMKHKRNSKLKCHICEQQFKEIVLLKAHLISNHTLEDIQASCRYCDATFKTENEISDHLFLYHKKVKRKSVYICYLCGYRTTTKSHYNQHRNTHLRDKLNKCQYCDYATNYMPNLKVHERIHTNEKLYACDFSNCGYRCSAKSALRSHQLKHYPEQNELYCDKCSYKTIYKQSLKRHSDCHKRNSVRLKL